MDRNEADGAKGEVSFYLQDVFQLAADKGVLLIVVHLWVVGDEGVLGADVDGVVDLPIDVPHFPGWVEQTLGETKRYGLRKTKADHGGQAGTRHSKRVIEERVVEQIGLIFSNNSNG